jgi:tRNA-modifying protein YgfZ
MVDMEKKRLAARQGALVVVRSELGALCVTGADRARWLNGLVTCELAKRKAGEGAYGLAVTKIGKIMSEVWILVGAERLLVGARAQGIDALRQHLDRHLIMEDAEVADASADFRWLFVTGPDAHRLVDVGRKLGAEGAAVDWTGRGDAAVLAVPAASVEGLLAALRDGGAELATDQEFEGLRIEWGLPRFGADFDEQNLPQEASLEQLAVSFDKGCYLGQEAVYMLQMRGHAKKHLMRIQVERAPDLAPGAEIRLADGTVVGAVTSATPAGDGSIAIGYVKHKHAQPGTPLDVAGHPAIIVERAGARAGAAATSG